MSRWFRFYDDAVNDPKVQRLSGDRFKTWVNLLCLASKNNGTLPPLKDIAFMLRMSDERVSALLDGFCASGLLDPVEVLDGCMSYTPHNWDKRQFKSDVSTDRVKRFRNGQRNVSVTPPDNRDREQTQKTDKKDAADAVAHATPDPSIAEREYFRKGKELLGKSAGGQLAKLKAAKGGNIDLAMAVIHMAATKENPAEYVAGAIRGPPIAKPLTEFQRKQQGTRHALEALRDSINTEASGRAAAELLSGNPGGRPDDVHRGAGSNLLVLPVASGRGSG